jgi:protein gp37
MVGPVDLSLGTMEVAVGKTTIEWCDFTMNPWIGCTKVSAGCALCYAETLMDHRYGKVKWGRGSPRRRTTAAYWRQPLKWNRDAQAAGVRRRVFCASLADVFDEEVSDEWRHELFALIGLTRGLDWLLLTKRPEKMLRWKTEIDFGKVNDYARAISKRDDIAVLPTQRHGMVPGGWPMDNVWMGVSIEDQKTADERIPVLLQTPAAIHFVSYEPALGPVDLTPYWRVVSDPAAWLGWVIVGGESGPGARPFNVSWARSMIHQCRSFGADCFVKQLGAQVRWNGNSPANGSWPADGVDGEEAIGETAHAFRMRLRDGKGGDPSEWPEDIRVREIPRPAVELA